MKRLTKHLSSWLTLAAVLAAASLVADLRAASVGAAGYTNSFTAQPPAADWSTFSITGGSGAPADTAGVDAAVQGVAATSITAGTVSDATAPPGANGSATWSSGGMFLQTRPTGNSVTLLMCTLANGLGVDIGSVTIGYDLAEQLPVAMEAPGHRVFYSLTGAAGSWTLIPSLSTPTAGRRTITLSVTWSTVQKLYLVWADDNDSGTPDTAYQIDNFSAKVTAGTQVPLVITSQPQDQSVVLGTPASFSVTVTGSSPSYQWQKDNGFGTFVNVSGATSPTYTISNTQLGHAGNYRVVINNSISSVTSAIAVLEVVQDSTGPRMITAEVTETTATNQIKVTWDEKLFSGGPNPEFNANNPSNYVITLFPTTNRVPVEAVIYNPGPPASSILRVGTNNWHVGAVSNYYLTVNKIRDNSPANNVVAPNSRIGISWPLLTNVFEANRTWEILNSGDISIWDTNIYKTNWYALNFQPDFDNGWGYKNLPGYYFNGVPPVGCLGDWVSSLSFQNPPVLFRTWFNWPAGSSSNATLRFQFIVDDGAVFYLNGEELVTRRYNMPSGNVDGPGFRASTCSGNLCITNAGPVTNLRPGTSNLLAVAIYNCTTTTGNDILFGMRVDGVSLLTGPVPQNTNPAPRITFSRSMSGGANRLGLSWTNHGYALESTTVPSASRTNYTGDWIEVQPMSNPYTNNSVTDPFRVYRLRRVTP